MENIDIAKELEAKNREIFFNKLNIDLEKSEELLLLSSKNQIQMIVNDLTNMISSISNDDKDVNKTVSAFFKVVINKLNNLLKKRSLSLKEKLNNIEEVEYQKLLNETAEIVINSLEKAYLKNIQLLIDEFSNNLDDFNKNRLSNYLTDNVLTKIVNNLKENFLFGNMIIYNAFLENYERMENINKKTIK